MFSAGADVALFAGMSAAQLRPLIGSFIDLEARPKPRNLLDLMFDPAGLRPFVEEWEKVAAGLLQRVRREAVGQVVDAELQKLLKRLRRCQRAFYRLWVVIEFCSQFILD